MSETATLVEPTTEPSVTPQTLPFVAVHYGWHTAPVGGSGNAVIAGHVVTLREGNVFRDLYRVAPGDALSVRANTGAVFSYRARHVALHSPADVEVMAPTRDARLTLITCGGTFDPLTRSFSHRLVVTALLEGAVPPDHGAAPRPNSGEGA